MKPTDSSQTIFITGPQGLAGLLAFDEAGAALWKPEEMKAMWQHQLAAQVEVDLSSVKSAAARELKESDAAQAFLSKSFRDLLDHPQPPIELLKLTKEFTKQTLRHCEDAQLKEVARALYYASYAAGLSKCGKRIGTLENDELRQGFSWALRLSWVGPTVASWL